MDAAALAELVVPATSFGFLFPRARLPAELIALALAKLRFRKRGSTTTTRAPPREFANAEDPVPDVRSGEIDAAALAELVAPTDGPLTAPKDVPLGDEAPEVATLADEAPDEATLDAPPSEEVPVDAAPDEVPVDAAPWPDNVLAPKLLGSSTIRGLLCAAAAELAEDEEDTRGEAIGPRLFAATAALTLFKDVKACFENIELREGTLKAETVFPELPDDKGATDPGLILIAPEDAPEVADADPDDPVAVGLNAVKAPELAEDPADPAVPGAATADAPEFADEPTDPTVPDPKDIGLNPADAPEVAEEAPVFTPKPA